MSLTGAIRFGSLLSQLTPSEVHTFLSTLIDQQSNLVLTALFNYLQREPVIAKSFNNLAADIQKSRRQRTPPPQRNKRTLDTIPVELIGNIASYLPQASYFSLCRTNRIVYISCNTPNQLQHINLMKTDDYSRIALEHYPSVVSLSLNLSNFQKLQRPRGNQKVLSKLKFLNLTVQHMSFDSFSHFMSTNFIDLRQVTRLQCDDVLFQTELFAQFLTEFSKLEYLEAYGNIDIPQICNLLAPLKGIRMYPGFELQRDMIHTLGHNWEYMQFIDRESIDYNLSAVDFGKLEQLNTFRVSSKSLCDLLQSAVHLKKVRLIQPDMNCQETEHALANILERCHEVQYVEVSETQKPAENSEDDHANEQLCYAALNGIERRRLSDEASATQQFAYSYSKQIGVERAGGGCVDGIERGVFRTKHQQRNRLHIHIQSRLELNAPVVDAWVFRIGRIVNWLQSSQTQHFMLRWSNEGTTDDQKRSVVQKLTDVSSEISVYAADCSFVITNKHCNINGFAEKWKF
eukprot:CAMPEP_0197074936 /NCGR_PEP_ID=MMETSP1384-20130603/211355_1 /TAXON_ID=29189 /ORGANISM="Ammonia sp." /LENGTH=515 /DNA_ID=CAMNT_0042513777 /DNA_START=82 /DNA_END=1628 /DNA_ORIENTATION=+